MCFNQKAKRNTFLKKERDAIDYGVLQEKNMCN